MDYLQVALTTKKNTAEEMSALLETAGALSVTIESANEEEIFDAAEPNDPAWTSQRLTALFDQHFDFTALTELLKTHPAANDVKLNSLPDQDWERNWLEQFQPIKISESLWVCPSWLDTPDPEANNLIIDPGLAFGTGTHQTTHLCLEYLSKLKPVSELVIDYGCGSGILGIAALKLGASEVIAIDVDPKALQATESNARINKVSTGLQAGYPDDLNRLLESRQSSLVIANILADTLIALRETLIRIVNAEGTLILSGVLEEQTERVVSAFSSEFDFTCDQRQEWMLLVGRKRSP